MDVRGTDLAAAMEMAILHTVTDEALVDILAEWSTSQVLEFVHDESQMSDDRRTVWAAFCATNLRQTDRGPVMKVPGRLVDKFRARLEAEAPGVAASLLIEPA
jgi:hypothetical protein